MARKKAYGEIIAEHIAAVIESRQIEEVLHFTRLENLPSILERGILTQTELMTAGLKVFNRLDEENDAVSVSISCYFPRMFKAKRDSSGNSPWAILVLNPSLLWNYPCRFFRNGAPTNATKYDSRKRYGGYALERLFEDCSPQMDGRGTGFRSNYGLLPSWPTFPDAEVQVMSSIHHSFIIGVWVETHEGSEFVRAELNAAGYGPCEVAFHPFDPRVYRKPYSWG